jgi:phage baseplate assembly protein gpV
MQTGTDSEVPPKSVTQATAEVVVAPPALQVATVPTITGTVQVGKTLTAVPGTFTGGLAPVTLQTVWESSADGTTGWAPVAPTDPSKPLELVVDASLQGQHLRVKTIATDATVPAPQQATALGAATATVAAPADVPLLAGTAPTITGSLVVGSTLTAAGGTATAGKPPITYTYRWERAAAATGPWSTITGATGNTYVLTAADAGKFLRVVAVATDANTPTGSMCPVPPRGLWALRWQLPLLRHCQPAAQWPALPGARQLLAPSRAAWRRWRWRISGSGRRRPRGPGPRSAAPRRSPTPQWRVMWGSSCESPAPPPAPGRP